jgi:hypothetical protein
MPVSVQVRVVEARDLPVMDSRSELTDAYVEVKFGDELHRTNVCRRTLCPVWNADFRFEAEDTEIQDEVLEARVYDYDTISANDPIGKIYITLNPLLAWDAPSQLAGWYPIYDTLRGMHTLPARHPGCSPPIPTVDEALRRVSCACAPQGSGASCT